MSHLIPIDADTLVSGQIAPEDIAAAVAAGVTMIVNNRPDGEEPGQPAGEVIRAAAEAAGLDYRHIPVAGGFSQGQVTEMAEALAQAEGKVLAFCRSGTRSTYLWALARASQGVDGNTLFAQAAAAGYDLSPLRQYLQAAPHCSEFLFNIPCWAHEPKCLKERAGRDQSRSLVFLPRLSPG